MAEEAVVKIINKFVEMIEVKDSDEKGVTFLQLPPSSQNDANFREELRKPIDKYDWLSFKKISRQVFFPESERFTHCKHILWGLLLQILITITRILSIQSVQGLTIDVPTGLAQ